jgi:hypothetical protein
VSIIKCHIAKRIKLSIPDELNFGIATIPLKIALTKKDMVVYQNEQSQARIVITKAPVKSRIWELPYYKLFYERFFASLKVEFITSKFFKVNGRKCVRIEFINKAVVPAENEGDIPDQFKIYNVFLVTSLGGRLTLMNFSYLYEKQEEWKDKIEASILSIKFRKFGLTTFVWPRIGKRRVNSRLLKLCNFIFESAPDEMLDKKSGLWHQPVCNALLSSIDMKRVIRPHTFKPTQVLGQILPEQGEPGYFFTDKKDKIADHTEITEGKTKQLFRVNQKLAGETFYRKHLHLGKENLKKIKRKTALIFHIKDLQKINEN